MYLFREVPVTQNMASGRETRTVSSKDNTNSVPVISCDKSCARASISCTQCSIGDISDERKWQFRPPPRGLTPNEYVLCRR